MKVRYLLDENVEHSVRDQLKIKHSDIDIICIGDLGTPHKNTSDVDILKWIEANNFILVTHNRRTIPTHLENHLANGGHIPGILLISKSVTIGELIDELELIWEASTIEEYFDRIEYLPI